MIYFIELWNAKPTWKALSKEERNNFMGEVGAKIETLLKNGARVTTCSINNEATQNRADYDYIAIWNFRDQGSADIFQSIVDNSGWYKYFDQVNAMGELDTVDNILVDLIQS